MASSPHLGRCGDLAPGTNRSSSISVCAWSQGLVPSLPLSFQMGATPVLKKPADPFPQEGELSNVLRTRCSGPRGNAVARRCSRREGGRDSPGWGSGWSLRDSRCQPLPAWLRPGGGCPPRHTHTVMMVLLWTPRHLRCPQGPDRGTPGATAPSRRPPSRFPGL